MMDINQTYCDNRFAVYGSKVITLYTLNICSAICQSCLHKTERKKSTGASYNFLFCFSFSVAITLVVVRFRVHLQAPHLQSRKEEGGKLKALSL